MNKKHTFHYFCSISLHSPNYIFFFFNDTATTEIYTLSLHDALPICNRMQKSQRADPQSPVTTACRKRIDRKSTRLNSSHQIISYAVFCLKKKKINNNSYI